MFRYIFGDILVSMPARWNKKLMAEEKLAKIEDQEEKKKKEETIVRKRMRRKGRVNGN